MLVRVMVTDQQDHAVVGLGENNFSVREGHDGEATTPADLRKGAKAVAFASAADLAPGSLKAVFARAEAYQKTESLHNKCRLIDG